MFRPVRQFMGERGVIALGVAEGLERRHLHVVEFLRVIGAIAAVLDGGVSWRRRILRRGRCGCTVSSVGAALA